MYAVETRLLITLLLPQVAFTCVSDLTVSIHDLGIRQNTRRITINNITINYRLIFHNKVETYLERALQLNLQLRVCYLMTLHYRGSIFAIH